MSSDAISVTLCEISGEVTAIEESSNEMMISGTLVEGRVPVTIWPDGSSITEEVNMVDNVV